MKKLLFILAMALVSIGLNAMEYETGKRDSILSNITGAKIPSTEVNLLNLGAKGDGKKDCLPAFKKAMTAYHRAGRNILP